MKVYDANQANMTKEEGHLAVREAHLERYRQTIMQLHQMTFESFDTIREEHAENKREQQSIINYATTIRNELKAETAKAEGSIKRLLKLKPSIITSLRKCEALLADIKEYAQLINLYESEHQIATLKAELALLSSHTGRQTATIQSIHKDIEGVENHHARIIDRQFKGISAKLANISTAAPVWMSTLLRSSPG